MADLQNLSKNQMLIGLGVLVLVVGGYYYYTSCMKNSKPEKPTKKPRKRENFSYDQIVLNAKNYTFIPQAKCSGCTPQSRPDFTSMTCSTGSAGPLKGMSDQQIKDEIDLHYKKPREMLDVKDLLPEPNPSGLNYGVDPGTDFANKTVWHRTTNARVKRKNWESGAAMIRGDLIIDPGQQSWFQHDNDYRDLTPGFIPKQYCGEVDVEDLTYNMHKIH